MFCLTIHVLPKARVLGYTYNFVLRFRALGSEELECGNLHKISSCL